MATLEYIDYQPHRAERQSDETIQWVTDRHHKRIKRLPQIVWVNGKTWSEANVWALEMAQSRASIKTVIASMQGLLTYARWLEAEGVDWTHFPRRESERALYRYRGALTEARDSGQLAPSTVSSRMAQAVRFYRWVLYSRLLSPESPMWKDRIVRLNFHDAVGFERAMKVATTDLAIPNRRPAGALHLESGLMPVTRARRDEILSFARKRSSEAMCLMLSLGFATGMRLGSLCDLKEDTICNAVPAPLPGFHQLSIGPGARPPVRTKYGISGRVLIPDPLLEDLKAHLWSTKRQLRKGKANPAHSDLAFLTIAGRPYEDEDGRHSTINTEMARLRKLAEAEGVTALRGFKFHRSRATFATHLLIAALDTFPETSTAITFVRDACLHKNEATTLEYVKFIEDTKAMKEGAAKFSEFFMGIRADD